MEDLGKHAKSIGFMPDMSMIDEGKKLAAEGRVQQQQQQQQTTRSSQQQQPEENAKKNQKVEIPKLALELDY